MNTREKAAFYAAFNHLALPARLPSKQDAKPVQVGEDILERVLEATITMIGIANHPFSLAHQVLLRSLQSCKTINKGGKLDATSLLAAFRTLECEDVLILHITTQNTGLLVRREKSMDEDCVIFESFEASPLSEHVLAAATLEFDFPGCALSIPFEVFNDKTYQKVIAENLEKSSTETLPRFASRSYKQSITVSEGRETVDPGLVTQIWMSCLEVLGRKVSPPILRKRIRDEVCWHDGAENPWRRCPFWLVLRVAVQRQLSIILGGELGKLHYKFLVCQMLAHLLEDSLKIVEEYITALNIYLKGKNGHPPNAPRDPPKAPEIELFVFLNTKLCKRMAKLRTEKERQASQQVRQAHKTMFTLLEPNLLKLTDRASKLFETAWELYKSTIVRRVDPLPRHASAVRLSWAAPPMTLSLPNSLPYLRQVLAEARGTTHHVSQNFMAARLPDNFNPSSTVPQAMKKYIGRYRDLSDRELYIENSLHDVPNLLSSCKAQCLERASDLENYLEDVGDLYNGIPEQKSIMLLTAMEMWMSMDECVIKLFPLVKDYNPGFPSESLDCLQLPLLKDMKRVHRIRQHLQNRHTECKNSLMTIFENPRKGCFGERYYDESPDSTMLRQLHEEIEKFADIKRERKMTELRRKRKEYEALTTEINKLPHDFFENEHKIKVHKRRCTRCLEECKKDNMRIQVHEHPLPTNSIEAKAVIFELRSPETFLAYRDATWTLITAFAKTIKLPKYAPKGRFLEDYPELEPYLNETDKNGHSKNHRIRFASTKKSSLFTHWSNRSFPVDEKDLFVPNGLQFGYYDDKLGIWPSQEPFKPSFAHHFELVVPQHSLLSSIFSSFGLAVTTNGLSSYQLVARQTKCPPGLNIHEFTGNLSLFSGKPRRWLQILIELGSFNLNFSSEATNQLISSLSLQIGPESPEGDHHLGVVHEIFLDQSFCQALLNQLKWRMEVVSTNWRENNCMDVLITLLLRLEQIGTSIRDDVCKLITRAREITISWITALRRELYLATDIDTATRCSQYTLRAALLCRRTFAIYLDDSGPMESVAVEAFLECSVALQDSLADPSKLCGIIKSAIIRDTKMVARLYGIIGKSLMMFPGSLMTCLKTRWPNINRDPNVKMGAPKFLADDPYWIEMWFKYSIYNVIQATCVHLHVLEGHFLVMGQPMGKLPPTIGESATVKQLFGARKLATFPSYLPGMTYTLASVENGHEVHLGLRNGVAIVQARFRGEILELIPPQKFFLGQRNFDLPVPLISNCAHWLNLGTGEIEIRQPPNIWKSKIGNWRINIYTQHGYRRNSTLVNPKSRTFQAITTIFDQFENPDQITVYQPAKGPLSVELRRLELSFSVNLRGWLESQQLGAEINNNQDARTWYGLSSKIVLTEVIRKRYKDNTLYSIIPPHHRRSIIVPVGIMHYHRHGPHVQVGVENNGFYGIYTINEALQRLDCQADPKLLYLKASYHAYTSFVLPDPLTGRTGTEEALHCLSSGSSQPWSPLTESQNFGLICLGNLTPRREYYPAHLKVMQKIHWNQYLTTNIQHDGFRNIVDLIQRKSRELATFTLKDYQLEQPNEPGEYHLTVRSQFRRESYCRPGSSLRFPPLGEFDAVLVYPARHFQKATPVRENILGLLNLIIKWPSHLSTTEDLGSLLSGAPEIAGFHQNYDSPLLSDLLDLDIRTDWGSLVALFCSFRFESRYRLMFMIAVMAFSHTSLDELKLMRTLVAFSIVEDLKVIVRPEWPSYSNFQYHMMPTIGKLFELIEPHLLPYPGDDRSISEFHLSAKLRKKLENEEKKFLQERRDDANTLIIFLLRQWPCQEPSPKGLASESLKINVLEALEAIRPEWLRLYQNSHLTRHTAAVQLILDRRHCALQTQTATPMFKTREQEPEPQLLPVRVRGGEFPTLSDLLKKTFSDHISSLMVCTTNLEDETLSLSSEMKEVQSMVEMFSSSNLAIRRQYGDDLRQSLEAYRRLRNFSTQDEVEVVGTSQLILEACVKMQEKLLRIGTNFERGNYTVQWLQKGGLWPIVTPVTLLESLRSISEVAFGEGMKEAIVDYALSVTSLQRFVRLDSAYNQGNKQKYQEESGNVGHTNWQPVTRPDWLLLEIDANLLIRPGQVDVALATICPASNSNSVLQMVRKTSCIMPMAAAILANGENLMRLIVPKPLLHQTAQLMHSRLGGLLGRMIIHVPFSRKTPTDNELLDRYETIHRDLIAASGVVLALPEHILSFKLSGQQQLSDGRIFQSKRMIQIQNWMSRISRDVIDEADSILAIRTQLIYPSGAQKTVDGHPRRWEVAEQLLAQIYGHFFYLHSHYPHSIEVVQRLHSGLPIIYFLRKDVEDELLSLLVNDIYLCRIPIFPPNTPKHDLANIKQFISEPRVSSTLAKSINGLYPDEPALRQIIYLLRGLLVHRILLMALKKRWNVQYGLHPNRDPMAVPFTAKGIPSEQAEWGHPDVAILFTCLAFYYDGLSVMQLRQTLEHVLKSDDPSQAYDQFTQPSTLPNSLRQWNAINVDDEAQLHEIWTHLRGVVMVVDYFLNNVVFPRYAKQFHMKLQASGWDIPLFHATQSSNSAITLQSLPTRNTLTTGFSGTNDWKRMLPLTIKQNDLPGLVHINAQVLSYLLEPRNREFVLAAKRNEIIGGDIRMGEHDLLRSIHSSGIRVLIDAGAQILEMDNLQLVKAWLEIDTEAAAAIYFDDSNKACVCYRQGKIMPLLASSFADDLSQCLVYLDEAHTRGTDLKLPPLAIGALTLGLGQTKDHTVQAAMRLRQLGTTQSVRFFTPPEVQQSILDLRKKSKGDKIDSYDVICWLLEQTCNGIEQFQPLYYAQGMDFCRRMQASLDNLDFLVNEDQREAYLSSVRQIEQQSLSQLYGVKAKKKPIKILTSSSPQIIPFMDELESRREAFQDSGEAVHGSALQEVEQEREVAHEVEAVREVQKPVHYTALNFPAIHRDILTFAKTGRLTADSTGYELAFNALGRTVLGAKHKVRSDVTSGRLFISAEFTRTVDFVGRPYDNFQRPVNWVLWSEICQAALVIIPEEAELLLPMIASNKDAPTHLITYAAPVARKMLHFGNLNFYAVPSLPHTWEAPMWLKLELGIYSGRLYFEYSEYYAILDMLGIRHSGGRIEVPEDEKDDISDKIEDVPAVGASKVFARRPLAFLQEWLTLQRKGQNFDQTPMGFVCQGKILIEDHHFFSKIQDTAGPKKEGVEGKAETSSEEDAEEIEDEAHGEVVNPDELATFDEGNLHVVENTEVVHDEDA
ncbi:hypothetical protein N431DRAFT_547638 [Stipitochalara longipes BDJ]|nr:hypothetical protein N431DRAFT_547638 [Stipitochalara longipes BDJ]